MQVFISWSGKRSKALAGMLKNWLPVVIPRAEPWTSDASIDFGKTWNPELVRRLCECGFGIACVTPENCGAPWLLFECGALAKSPESSNLVPILCDMTVAELPPPLSHFQASELNRRDMLKLVLDISNAFPTGTVSREAVVRNFEMAWPWLEQQLRTLTAPDETAERPDVGAMLAEILAIVRRMAQAFEDSRQASEPPVAGPAIAAIQKELEATDKALEGHDAIFRFYCEHGNPAPRELEDQHRSLRLKSKVLSDALRALTDLERGPNDARDESS